MSATIHAVEGVNLFWNGQCVGTGPVELPIDFRGEKYTSPHNFPANGNEMDAIGLGRGEHAVLCIISVDASTEVQPTMFWNGHAWYGSRLTSNERGPRYYVDPKGELLGTVFHNNPPEETL